MNKLLVCLGICVGVSVIFYLGVSFGAGGFDINEWSQECRNFVIAGVISYSATFLLVMSFDTSLTSNRSVSKDIQKILERKPYAWYETSEPVKGEKK